MPGDSWSAPPSPLVHKGTIHMFARLLPGKIHSDPRKLREALLHGSKPSTDSPLPPAILTRL
jgi:hypothetical protein